MKEITKELEEAHATYTHRKLHRQYTSRFLTEQCIVFCGNESELLEHAKSLKMPITPRINSRTRLQEYLIGECGHLSQVEHPVDIEMVGRDGWLMVVLKFEIQEKANELINRKARIKGQEDTIYTVLEAQIGPGTCASKHWQCLIKRGKRLEWHPVWSLEFVD